MRGKARRRWLSVAALIVLALATPVAWGFALGGLMPIPGFADMCGDYAETLKALQQWEVSSGPHKAARIEEYRELAEALESEILSALRVRPQGTKDGPT